MGAPNDTVLQAKSQEMDKKRMLCSPIEQLLSDLGSDPRTGLSQKDIHRRQALYGHNELAKRKKAPLLVDFLSHFANPLILILLIAGAISGALGEVVNAVIIYVMVLISVVLDFVQKYRAERAAESLKKRVATMAEVFRDGRKEEVHLSDLVPGDIVMLSAGDIVPADARIISAKDFFVDQSALTGESFPAEKFAAALKPNTIQDVTGWDNYLFMGTSIISGTATALVMRTGVSTEYGAIIKESVERRPETEFDKGLREFGAMITKVTMLLVLFAFISQAILKQNPLESLLFAIALAVGLTPELLPMILSINLSKGAMAMADKGVIVKRLASIQNFGSMDTLCTDKTGTLTENKVTLLLHVDMDGKESEKVFLYSFLNSYYQTGLRTPLDEAIISHEKADIKGHLKVDEIPFDFARRRSSVVVRKGREKILLTKGAPEDVFRICSRYESSGKAVEIDSRARKRMEKRYEDLSEKGFRVLAISYGRPSDGRTEYSIHDEKDLVFLGFVAFIDPPKKTSKESLQLLSKSGIELKVLTGDNELVTWNICGQLGFKIKGILTGSEIAGLPDEALTKAVEKANIFARVTPIQKERIIEALKRNGHVVGFLGDGINDAPPMRKADVSISVNNAVDVAKESADLILLHKSLHVLYDGVLEGRKTFGNTMKYIQMGISSNFGNMFSAAGASLFMNFLPMLPIQILLNNLLYDFSEMTISTDNVDKEYVEKPKRMDVKFIKDFMVFFGPFSSLFDFLTFGVMIFVFNASASLFQTAWFMESLCTQTMIIFIIRTRRPFYQSRPGLLLAVSSLLVVAAAMALPYTPLGAYFGFTPPPMDFLLVLAGFVVVYLGLVEFFKARFYREHPGF
ncbi:putative copper-exporting P-type ATPase A [uncultured archaeon]|nr:putative copper-exporting P-type ATPase A [uncultured archaeon]